MRTVSSVTLTDGSQSWTEACDILCSSYGLVPNVELALWLGCSLHGGAVEVNEDQVTSVDSVFCAGEPTGIGGSDLALVEGQIAGLVAAGVRSKSAGLKTATRGSAANRLPHGEELSPPKRAPARFGRRHHRLSVRGCGVGSTRGRDEPSAGETLHTSRDGSLSGQGLWCRSAVAQGLAGRQGTLTL